MSLIETLRATLGSPPPLPAAGSTAERHKYLFDLGRRDLSLARLAEAHWDAVAILAEAGREPAPGMVYGVWAAEIPGKSLSLHNNLLSGTKPFCSGAGLIDHALITVAGTEQLLLEVDLNLTRLSFDHSQWHSPAFAETNTASVTFCDVHISSQDVVGGPGFYLDRAGFWHGACGPAACWAGGAAGLVDWAAAQTRKDAHTLAHLGAMRANLWALEALLETAGREMDTSPEDKAKAHIRALTVRHLVEVHATDILRRLPRAYGPYPLAFSAPVSKRYAELDLYLRQSHAERDLEVLGDLRESASRLISTPKDQ